MFASSHFLIHTFLYTLGPRLLGLDGGAPTEQAQAPSPINIVVACCKKWPRAPKLADVSWYASKNIGMIPQSSFFFGKENIWCSQRWKYRFCLHQGLASTFGPIHNIRIHQYRKIIILEAKRPGVSICLKRIAAASSFIMAMFSSSTWQPAQVDRQAGSYREIHRQIVWEIQ